MVLPKIDADTGPEIQKEYLENRDYIADVLGGWPMKIRYLPISLV